MTGGAGLATQRLLRFVTIPTELKSRNISYLLPLRIPSVSPPYPLRVPSVSPPYPLRVPKPVTA
jgi:hypothetical protein